MQVSPGHPIMYANRAFLDLTGYNAGEIIVQNFRFMQGKKTAASDIAAIRTGLSDSEDFQIEILEKGGHEERLARFVSMQPLPLLVLIGAVADGATGFRQLVEASRRQGINKRGFAGSGTAGDDMESGQAVMHLLLGLPAKRLGLSHPARFRDRRWRKSRRW